MIREQLKTADEITGRSLTLTYDADGRLETIKSHDERTVTYEYIENAFEPEISPGGTAGPESRGNLAKVNALENIVEEYRYPDPLDCRPNSDPDQHLHNLTFVSYGELTDPVINEYDFATDRVFVQRIGQPRVVGEEDESGESIWTFDYNHNAISNNTRVTRQIETPGPSGPTTSLAETLFLFDDFGLLKKKTDDDDRVLVYNRESGRPYLTSVEVKPGDASPADRTVNFVYGTDGNIASRSVALSGSGHTMTETWTYVDDLVDVSEVTSTESGSTVFTTDVDFVLEGGRAVNIDTITRLNGATPEITDLGYDGNGQLTTIAPPAVDGDGFLVRRIYYADSDNDMGQSPPLIKNGLLAQISLEAGGGAISNLHRTFDYDAKGHLSEVTDARDHKTGYESDDLGRLVRVTEKLESDVIKDDWETTFFRYSAPNAASPGTGLGGRYLAEVETGAKGDPASPANAGQIRRLLWDKSGRLVKIERSIASSFEVFASFEYDSDGNRTKSTISVDPGSEDSDQPNFQELNFEYDGLRRLVTTTDPSTTETHFQYDALGNRTHVVQDAGMSGSPVTTITTYDELDRVVSVDKAGLVTEFRYDALGNVTEVEDPKDQVTTYMYDPLSRLKSVEYPLTPTVTYMYDERSRLDRVVNARTSVLEYTYESWGGLEDLEYFPSVDDADNGTNRERLVSYTYDDNANIETVGDTTITEPLYTFTYDALNRVDTAIAHYIGATPVDRRIDNDYDRFGNRSSMTVERLEMGGPADPFTTHWRYNDLNQLFEVVFPTVTTPDPAPTAAATHSLYYWSNDKLRRTVHGNGVESKYRYHDTGPTKSITVATGTGELHGLQYVPDARLNVDMISESLNASPLLPAWDYDYDDNDRLTSVDYPATLTLPASDIFGYDASGNRDASGSWSYDSNNRLTSSPSVPSWCWDDDGNVLEKRDGSSCSGNVTESFVYDTANRLQSWVDGPGLTPTAEYQYDPFGRRIAKEVAGTTTYYLWNGQNLLAEYEGAGAAARTKRYAYAGGFSPMNYATGAHGSETVYEVHTDDLDTPRILTDSSQAIAWRAAYQAYGEAHLSDPSTLGFNIRFPGQYYDAETGLHYNRFRYYDPSIGRYTSADPIGQSGGVNVYAYALNNPVNLFDPFGLDVNYNGFVVNNPRVRSALDRLDRNLPGRDIEVTGGDRYIDSDGNVRSSTTGDVVPRSRPTTPHAEENGARAVDLSVPGATNHEIRDAAADSGFPRYNTEQDYDDGHTHVALPNTPSNYIDPGVLAEFCRQNPSVPNCEQPPDPCP